MHPDELPDDLLELVPIILSERDWEIFVETLDNPPASNEAFKKLMTEFGPWKDGAKFTVGE